MDEAQRLCLLHASASALRPWRVTWNLLAFAGLRMWERAKAIGATMAEPEAHVKGPAWYFWRHSNSCACSRSFTPASASRSSCARTSSRFPRRLLSSSASRSAFSLAAPSCAHIVHSLELTFTHYGKYLCSRTSSRCPRHLRSSSASLSLAAQPTHSFETRKWRLAVECRVSLPIPEHI